MVTITKIGEEYNSQILEISGLSTDPKPVGQIDGVSITNGSTFKEIDTGKEYTYNESAETWHVNKTASSGDGGGLDGEDGGYYTPGVTQPTTNTMQISFTPSKSDMPNVNPVTVNLPVGENSGENVNGGMSATAKTLLITILRNSIYSSDQSANITALANALESSGDSSGGGESGGTETATYTITNNLTEITTSNAATTAESNTAYTATLTPSNGYRLYEAAVTMGGYDITDSVYTDGVISIPAVIGNVVITATAIVDDNVSGYINLFDKNSMVITGSKTVGNGYISGDGNASYAVVAVEPGKQYALQGAFLNNSGVLINDDDAFGGVTLESGAYRGEGYYFGVSSTPGNTTAFYQGVETNAFTVAVDSSGKGYTFTVPDGCVYCAFTVAYGGTDYSDTFMLEIGDTCHDYVPYAGKEG